MIGKSGTEGKAGSGLSTEQSNKILLLLFGVLILAIFMDGQARSHYESVRSAPPTGSTGRSAEEGAQSEGGSEGAGLIPPIRRSHPYRPTIPVIRQSAREIFGAAGEALPNVAGYPASVWEREASRKGEEGQSRSFLQVEQPEPIGSVTGGKIGLYFIRFRRTRTDLVRVRRSVAGKTLPLRQALDLLQRGPLVQERGLLTAFDSRIPVHSLELRKGTVTIDVGAAIERNGRRIVRDRLAQIHFTLRQFPEVQRVRILVDGVPREKIGRVKTSFPKKRRVLDFRSIP